jgi:DNA repair protein SbcD/Mre11
VDRGTWPRSVKLFHVADIHLGRRRLEGRLPDTDLAAAFAFIADQAIRAKADMFLIAGDLFDSSIVEPPHLRQAQKILGRLKANGIPVIAIEGNHDRAFLHSEGPTWIQFLAEDDLLVLLRTRFDSTGPILTPWDAVTKTGSWFDSGGIRFVGGGYLGAATPFKVRQIVSGLEGGHAHVLLLHAGPDYFVGESGGFSSSELKLLKEKICYLALGHIHRPMLHGDWACNPGSPENCDIHEASYDADSAGVALDRGYAVVELDPAQRSRPVGLRIHTNPRRPVVRLLLDCTPFGNKTKNGQAAFVEAAIKLIRATVVSREALIDLRLTGKLNLNRIALDQTLAAAEIAKETQVFAVSIDLSGLSIGGLLTNGEGGERIVTREELEKGAIRDAFQRRYHLGIEDRDEELCELFYNLKEAVRRGTPGFELAENIERSPLVDFVESGGSAVAALASAPETRDQEASA